MFWIRHTDTSGHQWFSVTHNTIQQVNSYLQWMTERFGNVPYEIQQNRHLIEERRDHNTQVLRHN